MEVGAVEVRVHLQRGHVGVAQNFLQYAQIGAALQHVGGKRVAQGVGVQIVAADDAAGLARQVEDALAPEAAAPLVQEHRSQSIGGRVGGRAREGRAPFGQIPAQRALGRAGNGHDALLGPLAEHAQEAVVEVDGLHIEPHGLAGAQPAAVEHFQKRPVAQVARPGAHEGVQHLAHFLDGKHVRQPVGGLGNVHGVGRVRFGEPLAHEEPVVAAHGGDAPAHGGDGEVLLHEAAFEGGHLLAVDVAEALHALAVEEGEVVLQIASVGLGRARRCPALDAQMGQVLVQGVL